VVCREQRSLMLGHTVKEGSETTEYYESGGWILPWALADVALPDRGYLMPSPRRGIIRIVSREY
jgi:hypothetical protein